MKRTIGSVLIVLSIVCMAATALSIVLSLAYRPANPTEDDQTTFMAFLLLTGVLFALEAAMFLCGRYLRHPSPGRAAEQSEKRTPTRPLPLIIYLTGSITIAVLATLGTRVLPQIDALGFLIGQPYVLTQLFLGGLLGINLEGDTVRSTIMAAANLLYFLALFYPVYGIVTTNRTLEPVRYKWMKTLLILFVGVHVLTAMALAMLMKA